MMKNFIVIFSLLMPTVALPASELHLMTQASFIANELTSCPAGDSVSVKFFNGCGDIVDGCSEPISLVDMSCWGTRAEAQKQQRVCSRTHFPKKPSKPVCSRSDEAGLMSVLKMNPGMRDTNNEAGIFVCGPSKRKQPVLEFMRFLSICSMLPEPDGGYNRSSPMKRPVTPCCALHEKRALDEKRPAFNASMHQCPVSRQPIEFKRLYR